MFGEKTTINCEHCGNGFTVSKAIAEKRGFRFCGVACARQYTKTQRMANRPVWTCEQCGQQFQRKYERKYPPRFCSQQCLGRSRLGATRADAGELIEKECAVCGIKMQTRKSSRLYCSRECLATSRTGSKKAEQPCEHCGNPFKPRHAASRFCSRSCMSAASTGEKSASWKGGQYVRADGYVNIYQKDHPAADGMGYVREHRFVMEQILGRYLKDDENVHHKNGKRDDNRRENLELWVKRQPPGQRIEDLVKWAREIIKEYGELFPEIES